MLAGLVVTGALFAILDISLDQSTRIRNETAADQVGRTALAAIVEELHSSCIYTRFSPIVTGSSPTVLVFEGASGNQGVLKEGFLRRIALKTEGSSGQILNEQAWKNTAGSEWPEFKFNTTARPTSEKQLATHVSESPTAPNPKGIFRYFKYSTKIEEGEAGVNTLELNKPLEGNAVKHELSETEAAETAAVEVKFTAAGSGETSSQLERSINMSSLVSLSFSVPRTEATVADGPCE
jgi:hypothetical protein